MKERPILFSEPMVRAILDGRKFQTRRQLCQSKLLKAQGDAGVITGDADKKNGWQALVKFCPCGQPGDLLWVRETHYIYGHWKKNGMTKRGKQRFYFVPNAWTSVRFFDDIPRPIETSKLDVGWYKRPSIHMLRKYSRILLEVTAVRIERLHEMSDTDGMREGWSCNPRNLDYTPRLWYADLWDKLNGPGSWEANPWVWVIEFKTKEIKEEVKFNGASQIGKV